MDLKKFKVMATTYPYYTAVALNGGILVKVFRGDKKFSKYIDAVVALSNYIENHKESLRNNYIILKYTSQYDCSIMHVFSKEDINSHQITSI